MGHFLKTVTLGALSGVAVAYFLHTEKGKEVSRKARRAVENYQANPEAYHQAWAKTASDIAETVKETATHYYGQVVSEDLAQTVQTGAKKAQSQFSQATDDLTHHLNQRKEKIVSDVEVEDIVIDLPQALASED